jgi:hypothetical protein
VSLAEITALLEAWRTAQRSLADKGPDVTERTVLQASVDDARERYLDAVREHAARHGYAWGQRSIHADIEELQEAEDQRAISDPGTPQHDLASENHRRCSDRIIGQLYDDHARSHETQSALRRLMGLPDDATEREESVPGRAGLD